MKMRYILLYIGLGLLLTACSADGDEAVQPQTGVLRLTSSIRAFEGEDVTRTNMEGTAFAVGDRMKLKIICPFSEHTNFGETTYSNSADGVWLLKWTGSNWGLIETSDSVDMMAHYQYTSSYSLFSVHEAQQTPYVYTASTWNENVFFMAPNAVGSEPKPFSQYSYIFHADQSKQADYLKSDLLWAQTYMQTGSYDVHLAFNHVMACLKITITGDISDNAIVTLEGMPDIDQREVVVGDYYAPRAKNLTHYNGIFDYSYKRKCQCAKADNGKVLGVAVYNDATALVYIYPMTGNPTSPANTSPITYVENSGVYTAHHASTKTYYLIVPPCELPEEGPKAMFWIRDGVNRWTCVLDRKEFKQGEQYPVNITLTSPSTP